MSDIPSIIQQLEEKRAAIDNALEALRGVSTEPTARKRGRPKGTQVKAVKPATKKRQLTAAGRKALSANMKRMWAAKRAAPKKG